MSGGSQHNPNGRQSQLGPAWSPLQLQVASFLSRAPQAHLSSERGVTWHTPTPPPHLYHVPAPSPPDPLQAMAMKGGAVYRHTGTPPDIYRHTPTPPDKHLLRHTPSPGDIKTELYPHLGPGRVSDKVRAEEAVSRGALGVDLSVSRGGGSPSAPAPAAPTAPGLSVRDAPTINSLIARAQPRPSHGANRVEALLERLAPAPVSPRSVIVAPRALSASPPAEPDEPASKRKRKPDRTVRLAAPHHTPPPPPVVPSPPPSSIVRPLENGDAAHDASHVSHDTPHNATHEPPRDTPSTHEPPAQEASTSASQSAASASAEPPRPAPAARPSSPPAAPPDPPARRKSRSGSAETIDDIAAMIASSQRDPPALPLPPPAEPDPAVTIDKLESVLASPKRETTPPKEEIKSQPSGNENQDQVIIKNVDTDKREDAEKSKESPKEMDSKEVEIPAPVVKAAAAPRRRSARGSHAEAPNVPVESPSEAKPAEPESTAPPAQPESSAPPAQPAAASFVEVENQLERMFAGIDERPPSQRKAPAKRRKSAPANASAKRRLSRGAIRGGRSKSRRGAPSHSQSQDRADSASNASSTKSKGPYIQIKGPCASPVSVSVMNASAASEEEEAWRRRSGRGARRRGLHASTLGLRYDAVTPDATWLCAFCNRGPHAPPALGDLFGPYHLDNDCEEYRALDEATRRRYESAGDEVWFHESCAVWAPGVVAAGARVWGLGGAVWGARAHRCPHCARPAAPLACHSRHCRARAHLPCAKTNDWKLDEDEFRAFCPRHA